MFVANTTGTESWQDNASFAPLEKAIADFSEYKYAIDIRKYATLLVCIVGILGNVTSMFVLYQKHNRKVSCYLYFGAIAIADNIMLINAGWYQTMVDFYPEQITRDGCRLVNSVWFGSSSASAYLLFFATLDR